MSLGNLYVVKGLDFFFFSGLPFLSMVNHLIFHKIHDLEINSSQGDFINATWKISSFQRLYHQHIKRKRHAKKIYSKALHLERRALRGF